MEGKEVQLLSTTNESKRDRCRNPNPWQCLLSVQNGVRRYNQLSNLKPYIVEEAWQSYPSLKGYWLEDSAFG